MRDKGEAGQAILIVAVALVVLILAAGLAIDIGYLRYERRRLQMAADSAAIAGANCIASPGCGTGYQAAGETSAAYNGFDHTSPQTTVTINPKPATGPHQGFTNYVEAIITQNVPTFFMRALGSAFSSFPVTARAVAYPGPGPGCIYALSGMTEQGFQPVVEAPSCTIADGGDLTINAGNSLQAQGILYAGAYNNLGASVSPAPIHGAPTGNPLAYLPTTPPAVPDPAPTSCGYTYCAGAYDTGLTITVPIGSTLSLQPGTYVIGGSGLTITDNGTDPASGTVTGAGVTFYINGGAVVINSGKDYSTCSGAPDFGSTVQLSAPADPADPFAGILFLQNGSQASTITLNNGDTCNTEGTATSTNLSYLWGVLYFPSAQLTLMGTGLDPDHGCSYIPRYTMVVASTLVFGGGDNNFGVTDCGGVASYAFPAPAIPDPIKDAVLVE